MYQRNYSAKQSSNIQMKTRVYSFASTAAAAAASSGDKFIFRHNPKGKNLILLELELRSFIT